jgi:NAD(P)-dependent dehydrogenase (short-subunit alcohol dehydrogenase family)
MKKTALVTGSTNNIGKSIAEALAIRGYHVKVKSRNEEEAKSVSENLSGGGSYFRADFSDMASIESLFAFNEQSRQSIL